MAGASVYPDKIRSGRESGRHAEGGLAKQIEQQTAHLPSDAFLWAAGGSVLLSLMLEATGHERKALFIGQWAPTLLILGLYNKLVKQQGSD